MDSAYTTRSLGEAGFLYLNQVQLLSAIDDRGYDYFTFDNKDNCARRLVEQFYAGATAGARELSLAMSQLRRESTQARRNR